MRSNVSLGLASLGLALASGGVDPRGVALLGFATASRGFASLGSGLTQHCLAWRCLGFRRQRFTWRRLARRHRARRRLAPRVALPRSAGLAWRLPLATFRGPTWHCLAWHLFGLARRAPLGIGSLADIAAKLSHVTLRGSQHIAGNITESATVRTPSAKLLLQHARCIRQHRIARVNTDVALPTIAEMRMCFLSSPSSLCQCSS